MLHNTGTANLKSHWISTEIESKITFAFCVYKIMQYFVGIINWENNLNRQNNYHRIEKSK